MEFTIDILQFCLRYMGINLGGRNVSMSDTFLEPPLSQPHFPRDVSQMNAVMYEELIHSQYQPLVPAF